MQCTIKFNMENAAFHDGGRKAAQGEVGVILLDLTKKVMNEGCQSGTTYPIRDSNGNKIGQAVFE